MEEDHAALRGLFIIDPQGVLQYAVVHSLNIGRSTEETRRVLTALQTGGLCPSNWKPGGKTLPVPEVEAAAQALGTSEPLAVDNEHLIGERFETNGLWPVYLLFDAEGRLRARAAGAAGLGVLGAALERMAPPA